MIFKKIVPFVFAVSMLLSINLFAGDTGKLAGKITDKSNGEALIGANILFTAEWVDGKEQTLQQNLGAASDINGEYYILNIPSGTYNVKVSYIGYREEIITKIKIVIDRTTRIDFELTPESFET
ncbi:MAG: carboxypeptidase-like regulatory domain-containing protein [Ignavibacteriales bacterium]|nr:carboxypeptidase-like regulatory domain-containing protein [Ignavibacteriales bacterium]